VYVILVGLIKSKIGFVHCVLQLRAGGHGSRSSSNRVSVITGVATGFPGTHSPTEHALLASGFHTYIHMHTRADKQAHAHNSKYTKRFLLLGF